MAPGPAFEARVAAALDAEASGLLGDGALDGAGFERLEREARRIALEAMGRALAARLDADRSDERGPRPPCPRCGGAAGEVSFATAGSLLHELAGLNIDAKTVERRAEALGREIAADERDRVEAGPASAPTLYLGLDGTGVPVRGTETEGRAGKRADGSAKTREAKLAMVWSAERTDADGAPARDPGSVTGSAAIESAAARDTDAAPAPFAKRVLREAARRGFGDAERRVVIGDGAAWIWSIADEHFPGAAQIVDVFHAAEHLFDLARAVYGDDSDLARAWARQRRDELLAGDFDRLLRAVGDHAGRCEDARRGRGYFADNRARMDYPAFRAMGLCIGSGVVEGACKNLVCGRLKRGGMRWTVAVAVADAILALLSCIVSNRFDDFWRRRAARK